MLLHYYDDENLVFVHRIDKRPDPNDFSQSVSHRYSIIYHISGDITYYIEDKVYKPQSGDIMLFNYKEHKRMVIDPFVPYERMLIQFMPPYDNFKFENFPTFDSLGFGVVSHIQPKKLKNDNLTKPLKNIMECNEDYSAEIIFNLKVFFSELQKAVQGIAKFSNEELYSHITEYICADLTENFSLDGIAENFHISRSKLNSLFKKVGGATVWDYITAKRLTLAKKLIEQGEKPTRVYLKCGFKDYSVFYRAYKAKFGISPREDKN